jgi:hypothetical protein
MSSCAKLRWQRARAFEEWGLQLPEDPSPMSTPEIALQRQALVDQALLRLNEIEQTHGATRTGIQLLRDELLRLARHAELFITDEFAPAQRGTFKDFAAYRLNRTDDTQRALYVSLALPGKSSPPHNHNNWAVLVGLKGVEVNRLYRADDAGGLQQIGEVAVGPGVGLGLLGDDIHSIHVQGEGDEPVWQLRFYERALEDQTDRLQFAADGSTEHFPPNPNTHDAVADIFRIGDTR